MYRNYNYVCVCEYVIAESAHWVVFWTHFPLEVNLKPNILFNSLSPFVGHDLAFR